MRFFIFFFLIASLATAAMAHHARCVQTCPAYYVSAAVCGVRGISDTDFEYADFSSNCDLSNANCALKTAKYVAISKEGVSCVKLAAILAPSIQVPLTGSEEIPPSP